MGIRLPLPVDATFIASLTWIGHIHLRIEELAPSEAAAADTTESMQTILILAKSLAGAGGGGSQPFDADTRAFVNSVSLERHGSQAVLSATVPVGLVERMVEAPAPMRTLPNVATKP